MAGDDFSGGLKTAQPIEIDLETWLNRWLQNRDS
jgi:hypothetical protein